ncbi:MAG: GspL/Epsl periplasmic domain-containing protein, partial [Henriciella sp.]
TLVADARGLLIEQRLQSYVEAGWPAADGDVERALAMASTQGNMLESRGLPSPLTMLAMLYQALDEGNDGDLKSVRYQSQRQEILVRIGFSDFVSVDQLSARLSDRGVLVTTGNARQNGSQVIGELTLRGSDE